MSSYTNIVPPPPTSSSIASTSSSLNSSRNGGEESGSKSSSKRPSEVAVDTTSPGALKTFQLTQPQTVFMLKNNLLRELTRSIQLVQKCYLEKEPAQEPLTNSDYSVHELCQQFDYVFLLGLKRPEEGYWKLVVEFTHRNVISDLKSLLNVTTNFGRGRAWIYHALNDNLMESYLRCILDDKKLVNRYYNKSTALITDDQALTVLLTLVAGLENVEFKLHNDVPYLDHSCWPTHLNIKRQVVDTILNSSISQLMDLNGSLSESLTLSGRERSLSTASSMGPSSTSRQTSTSEFIRPASVSVVRPPTKHHHNRQKHLKKSRMANNISLDNSTTSSVNNLSDANSILNDFSSEYSQATMMSSTMPNETNIYIPGGNKFGDKRRKPKTINKQTTQTDDERESISGSGGEELGLVSGSMTNRLKSVSMISSSLEMDKLNISIERRIAENKNNKEEEAAIENEIDRLKRESSLIQMSKQAPNPNTTTGGGNGGDEERSATVHRSKSTSSNHELAASGLRTSSHFDKKIQHIETYSQIIENATQNMDDCVKHMSSLYENYEKIYNDAQVESDMTASGEDKSVHKLSVYDVKNTKSGNEENSLYDMYPAQDEVAKPQVEDQQQRKHSTSKNPVVFTARTGSQSSLVAPSSTTDTTANKTDDLASTTSLTSRDVDRQSIDSSASAMSTSKISSPAADQVNENDYLDESNKSHDDDFKNEIRTDNNTKLLFSIEIFQNGPNEEFVKLYQASRGHSQGEIEAIFIMLTSYGVYIMTRSNASEAQSNQSDHHNHHHQSNQHSQPKKNRTRFNKESFISHTQMDYIEVSLCDQAFHLVCINKRQNCWITTASRNLTKEIIESIQVARSHNKQLKIQKISVFYEATQQKFAIKKFISNMEKLSSQEIEIKSYSLIFWEDQASQETNLIHKEGPLYFYHKSSVASSAPIEWKKGYFVLKNDVLTKYKTANDKRPTNVIKLNGEDFSGCRRNPTSSRPHTIELILSNSNALYLSAKSESEATDWLQSFCKVISLGNFHTDVPSNSSLPCCAVVTSSKLFLCHEDLNTGFYRHLEAIKLQEVNRISFDNDNPFYCILHDDLDEKKNRYWYIYFTDKNERNCFISSFKDSWEHLFQVQLTIEKCKNDEMRKRCIKGVRSIHKTWENIDDFD